MLKVYNYDIVFQEIPDEVTLALNISGCPNHCVGCHSPHLWEDIGAPIEEMWEKTINNYKDLITCVCFMGGDQDYQTVFKYATIAKSMGLKTAWYSGNNKMNNLMIPALNYYKIGSYKQEFGGLSNPKTNQKLYQIQQNNIIDITYKFWRKNGDTLNENDRNRQH